MKPAGSDKVSRCIVVECLSALQGGGQTYLRYLFANYSPSPGERVVAIVPPGLMHEASGAGWIEFISPEFPRRGLLARLLWFRFRLPKMLKELKADVVYCPGGTLSAARNGYRRAVAFRNMLPFADRERRRYPLGYMRLRLLLLRSIQGRAFAEADLVVFVSNHAKGVIDALLPNRQGASRVIPHGVGESFLLPAPRPSADWLPQVYVLYLSILDVYKAHLEVVEAWALMRRNLPRKEKLVLLGPARGAYADKVRRRIADLGLQEDIIVAGEVPHDQLPGFLQHAKANLFASSCENCPNILLEAMASGRPVLSSNYLPMPEFGGEAVTYFDPYDPGDLAGKLGALLDDDDRLARDGQAARDRARQFDWTRSAAATWDALRQLAGFTSKVA